MVLMLVGRLRDGARRAQGSHDRPGLVSGVQVTVGGMPDWSIEYEGESFARFYRSLPEYEQAVLTAALEHVLRVHGIDICAGEWGKPLGQGLYEFRVRRSLDAILTTAGLDPSSLSGADRGVLIRVFCTFHGDRIVVLYHGYDKKKDPSPRRQQKEIAKAKRIHEAWRRGRRH